MSTALKLPEYQYNQILLRLARLNSIDEGDLDTCYKEINTAVSEALQVDRASIWFYNDDLTSLICTNMYEKSSGTFSCGYLLESEGFPRYFQFLKEQRTLPINEVSDDETTHEFRDLYFKPFNIKSMLDAPIRISGKIVGIIRCETVGRTRTWTINDETFIANITDILARAIQAKERLNAIYALEKLVAERTLELEDQRTKSISASKMAILGEMAGAIAHEINNPLAIILGFLSMLKSMENDPDVTKEEKIKVMNDIKETTLRIDKIVKGLRFFARDGSQDVFIPTPLEHVLEETLTLCSQKFYQKGCKIIVNIPRNALMIRCQPVSISQAILNLLGNAYDAIEDNPVKWIKIDCLEINGHISITVTDSGSGIDPDLYEKIMVPFFTTKAIGKGTGLGLSIVKGIVEQHNGTFFIDNTSKNTSFVMRFPKEAS